MLFKRYQKLTAMPTAGESSTGWLSDAMDGEIYCDSQFGNGPTFTIKLQHPQD